MVTIVAVLAAVVGLTHYETWHASRSNSRADAAACVRTTYATNDRAVHQSITQRAPLLAVIGASFSAGEGSGSRQAAWPTALTRRMHWRLAVSAEPGAGYAARGEHGCGPFLNLANRLDLARLQPNMILVQGGHNDIGKPLGLIRRHVVSLIDALRVRAPGARIGVLTVFTPRNRLSRMARLTNRTIVRAARHAEPNVLVINPMTEKWRFPRVRDGLHPSKNGHRVLAGELDAEIPNRLPSPSPQHRSTAHRPG